MTMRPLVLLFSRLLRQLEVFGILSAQVQVRTEEGEAGNDDFGELVEKRVRLLHEFAEVKQRDEEFGQVFVGKPFVYNTRQWPEGAVPAGYFEIDGPVTAGAYLWSLSAMWRLQKRSTSAAAFKILKAAGWMLRVGGVPGALQYILALQRAGWVFSPYASAEAIVALLDARRKVATDEHIFEYLFEGPAPDTKGWSNLNARAADDGVAVRELNDDLLFLLSQAEAHVELVVAARSLDDWLLGQHALYLNLTTLRLVFEHFGAWSDLLFVGRTARLEEIRADSKGGVSHMISCATYPYKWFNSYIEAMASAFHHLGEDWIDRFLEERALVPRELEHLIVVDGGIADPAPESLPENWRVLSSTIAPIFAACRVQDSNFRFRRQFNFDARNGLTSELANRFFDKATIYEEQLRYSAICLFCDGAIDSGEKVTHEQRLVDGGLARDGIEEFGRQMLLAMSFVECQDMLLASMAAQEEGRRDVSAGLRSKLNLLYPFQDLCKHEDAIFDDEDGNHKSALSHISDALLLDPFHSGYWQSLVVILSNLGESSADQDFASAVRMWLEREQRNGSDGD